MVITPIPSSFQITLSKQLDGLGGIWQSASSPRPLLVLLLLPPKVPVVQESNVLDGLGERVGRVAGEQQIIPGLDLPRCVNFHPVRNGHDERKTRYGN